MFTRWNTCLPERLFRFIAIGFLIVGCSPSSPRPPAVNAPPTLVQLTRSKQIMSPTLEITANADKSPQTVIRVGTGDSDSALNSHQMVIQTYEEMHPDVLVQMEAVAGTDYYARLMTLVKANRAPDVMNVGDDYVRFFVDKGLFLPLEEAGVKTPFDSSPYLPGLLEPGKVDGKQYFLPQDYTTLALYFNKKLFDAAGLPYPTENWTWTDLLSAARKLTIDRNKDGIPEQWGIQMNANWENGFEYWVAAAGGRLISEDGKKVIGYMDSPETIRALQFYADLYHKYRVAPPPADLMAWAGGNTEFENGTAAMVIFGRWTQAGYLMNPRIDFGITAPPGDKLRANILFWRGCGISSSTENKEQTADFLKFYNGEGSSKIWGDERLPVVKSALDEPSQLMDLVDRVWISELNHLTPRAYTYTPFWEETARNSLRDALSIVIMDPSADPAQVLRQTAGQIQADLDTYQ